MLLASTESLLIATVATLGLLFVLLRRGVSNESHRSAAACLVVSAAFLPTLLASIGVNLRLATGAGVLVMLAAAAEGAMVSRGDLVPYPCWPRRSWAALWVALFVIHTVSLLHGAASPIYQLMLFAGLGVLWWTRIDHSTVVNGVMVAWIAFAGLMVILLPFGVLGWPDSIPNQELSETSPYYNPLLQILGLDARWSGMFEHPNGLGAFSAVGIGLALSRDRPAWPLLFTCVPLTVISSSRTAAIAAAAGICAYILLKRLFRRRPALWVVAVMIGIVTIQSLARDNSVMTANGRVDVWKALPGFMGGNWLWGLGPDAGVELVKATKLPVWAGRVHSALAEHLLTGGLVSVAVVLVLASVLVLTVAHHPSGLPLLVVLGVLAAGDNYSHLLTLTIGAIGYAAVIGVCTERGDLTRLRAPRSTDCVGLRRDPLEGGRFTSPEMRTGRDVQAASRGGGFGSVGGTA